jgi:oligosaccharide repeat unit polymerase
MPPRQDGLQNVDSGRQQNPFVFSPVSVHWFTLMAAIAVTGWCFATSDDLTVLVCAFAGLAVVAFALGRLDLLHPFTWYVPPFCLYSISLPLLALLDVMPDLGSLPETLFVEWLALVAFVLSVGPARYKQAYRAGSIASLEEPAWLVFGVSLLGAGLFVFGIWHDGLTDKYQVLQSFWGRFDPAFSTLSLAYGVLLAIRFSRGKLPWALMAGTLLWNALAFAVGGQRAFIFRTLLITLILFHVLYRRLSTRVLAMVAAAGLIAMPVLQDLKNVLVAEQKASVEMVDPVVRVLGDELLTASDNLQFLIDKGEDKRFHGETLLWDLQQIFRIRMLESDASMGPSPTMYFNRTYYPTVVALGGGRGFTFAGEGYMNFGAPGAALWYLGLGLLLRALYRKASSSIPWLVMYVSSIPLTIYVTRADFSGLVSPFLKHIALPLLVIYAIHRLAHGGRSQQMKPRESGERPPIGPPALAGLT